MPLDLTGIQNVGEFYSHHYLDALLENDLKGLFAKWRGDDDSAAKDAPDKKLERLASEFFKAKSLAKPEYSIESRYEPSHRIHVAVLEALGYRYSFEVRYINGQMAVPVLGVATRDGHEILWIVETPFAGKDGANVDDASPLDQRPFRGQYPQHALTPDPSTLTGTRPKKGRGENDGFVTPDERWEDLIGDIFHADEPPRWVMLLAGRFIYLIDRTKWGRGQYLLFDLDEILGRKQSATLRATAALLSRDALCPDDGVPLHDTLDENSHKHAYGVSSDLKYGLRKAVELLANEYVYYQRTVARGALFQDENLARKLTDEALIYMYRLLFLLYAEARASELDVVPVKAEAYMKGYSVESLRDLEQVPLTTPQAQNGYYINESLNILFKLVDEGHNPQQLGLNLDTVVPVAGYDDYGFRVRGLQSPLFNRQSTPLLASVKFRNSVLQEIIQLLSLSREKRGRRSQRGRISYAQLGINQLGAVYEALLSYSGFFASERMYEVKPADAKESDETAQTYFILESDLERYEADEFVYEEMEDGTSQRKRYEKGTFIFRLAGRDREKSASYYTPEVLTQCTVKYSLKELLKDKSADEVLNILLLEPAMGSGAFANEAINQLADAYLERKQKELSRRIPADEYRTERQKVKYYLAVHNTYGVDLNPTAVELARVSLWLNILYPNSPTPWFGARLATGNSLIGARRQVYSSEDVKSGAYVQKAPEACPMFSEVKDGKIRPRPAGSIYHWLLPDAGMAAFDSDKVIKELAPAETAAIKKWRKDFNKPFTAAEIKNLIALSDRADELWQKVLDERMQFLENTRQPAEVWGQPKPENVKPVSIEQCERELAKLRRPTGAYARMKLAMDYWCALWFWQIPAADKLPTRQQFLDDMAAIFNAGEDSGFEKEPEQIGMFDAPIQPKQAKLADLKPITIDELLQEPRLNLVSDIASQQRFHHWEIALVEAFATNDGFDLIVGNPPWVRLGWDETGLLSDHDPYLAIRKLTASEVSKIRSVILQRTTKNKKDYLSQYESVTGSLSFLSAFQINPLLSGQKTNLYKCFITEAWRIGAKQFGCVGLLHPEGVFDDSQGGSFREQLYYRLRHLYRFTNVLKLFSEILHWVNYCVCVYSPQSTDKVSFYYMSNVFHPKTIDLSFTHDGVGAVPPIKDETDNWELNGHLHRIIEVDRSVLSTFTGIFSSPETPLIETQLPSIHSREITSILQKFSNAPVHLRDVKDEYFVALMFDETKAQKDGVIKNRVDYPETTYEWIISGPQFYVANPLYKNPNENCKNPLDYSEIDLLTIPDDYLPRTTYFPAVNKANFIALTPKWNDLKVIDQYRHIHRRMLSQTGERTLTCAIIPPGVSHTYSTSTITFKSNDNMVCFSGFCSSLVLDFLVKSTGKANLVNDLIDLFPVFSTGKNLNRIISRTLRLNCVTSYYSALWESLFKSNFAQEGWSRADSRLSDWKKLTPTWQRQNALRNDYERRQALIEIDVLASMELGLTIEELLTIYRVQFPVLQKNERRLRFDQRGMEVPMKTIGGELGVDENHPRFGEMVPPFTSVDREDDYRVAWAFFEKKLKEEKK